jgi:hypothetical protein
VRAYTGNESRDPLLGNASNAAAMAAVTRQLGFDEVKKNKIPFKRICLIIYYGTFRYMFSGLRRYHVKHKYYRR